MVCQTQSTRQEVAPLEGIDVPSIPFEKISMGVSGPYGEISRGNTYMMNFVDWLMNWPCYKHCMKKTERKNFFVKTVHEKIRLIKNIAYKRRGKNFYKNIAYKTLNSQKTRRITESNIITRGHNFNPDP